MIQRKVSKKGATVLTGSVALALAAAILACIAGSVLFWFVVERLKANQIIAGLGLTGLGLGGTSLAIQSIFGSQAAVSAPAGLPRIGATFGAYGVLSVLVLLMPFVVFLCWVLLRRTRFGLRLAASGEHPFAARSVGVNPSAMRLVALMLGGVLCALAGAELAAGSLLIFSQNMTAGRGFMGFAAVIFGAGHPLWATPARLNGMRALGNRCGVATAGMLEFSESFDLGKYGWEGALLHGPCVPAFMLDPTIFSGRQVNVSVELDGAFTQGMTVADWWGITGGPGNAFWVRDGDPERYYALLLDCLARLP